MRFAEPWALLGLLLVPAAFLLQAAFQVRRSQRLEKAGDPRLLLALTDGGRGLLRTRRTQRILFAAALGLTAIALARPQLGMRSELRRGRGMDVVLALDLSRSMYARDVVPSRLERAKIELGMLLERLRGDRVGLVGFTSIGLPLCPLTVDHAALRIQLRGAEPEDLPRGGTSVAAALRAGRRMLEAAGHPDADRAIVVLTDGEAHQGDPVKAAEAAVEDGVVVHVVGVGSRVGEPIPKINAQGKLEGYLKDAEGKTVVSRLDEETLRAIADAGEGKLALPSGDGGLDLEPVARHLASLRKADLQERTVRVYEERYTWFLVPAFLTLLLATLLRPTRRPGVPRIVLGLGLILTGPGLARAQNPFERTHPKVQEGIEALREGRGADARKAFDEAAASLGDDPRISYDRALADVARGELNEAMEGFRVAAETAENPNLRARAQVGLGNALRKLKRYEEAARAYREALLSDPSVHGAARNLELAQRMKEFEEAQPPSDSPSEDEQDPSEDAPEEGGPDAGTQDSGPGEEPGDPDGGAESGDGGEPGDGGDSSGEGADAEPDAQDAGVPPNEDSSDGGQTASPPEGGDAGTGSDGGLSSGREAEDDVDLSRQEAEAILDALQAEEEALERKRLLERFEGRPVEKDW